jgi:hypothetical protein
MLSTNYTDFIDCATKNKKESSFFKRTIFARNISQSLAIFVLYVSILDLVVHNVTDPDPNS